MAEWKTWTQGDTSISISPALVRLAGFGLNAAESGTDISLRDFVDRGLGHEAVRRFMGAPVLREALQALESAPGTESSSALVSRSWQNGGYSLVIQPVEICIGQDDRYGGNGTSWSVRDFLADHQTTVRKVFGDDVIQEIMAELRSLGAL
ncbi:MAG: hypothetical protein HY042_01965 [Spirochaetia bacterium]|nr:hypothetical protein [Spirochaetia bacterium]